MTGKTLDYEVRWTGWDGSIGFARYEITGGPDTTSGYTFTRIGWRETSWTLWGAKRKIRKRKRTLARAAEIAYREEA